LRRLDPGLEILLLASDLRRAALQLRGLNLQSFEIRAHDEGLVLRLPDGRPRLGDLGDEHAHGYLTMPFDHPAVLLGLLRLLAQRFELGLHLSLDVVNAREVVLSLVELPEGLVPSPAVLRRARRFLEEGPAVLSAEAQDAVYLVLPDESVGALAKAGVEEQLLDVPQPAAGAVDEVVALAAAMGAARDGDLGVGQREGLVGVVQHEGYLGDAQGLAALIAVEDDVSELVRADRLG